MHCAVNCQRAIRSLVGGLKRPRELEKVLDERPCMRMRRRGHAHVHGGVKCVASRVKGTRVVCEHRPRLPGARTTCTPAFGLS